MKIKKNSIKDAGWVFWSMVVLCAALGLAEIISLLRMTNHYFTSTFQIYTTKGTFDSIRIAKSRGDLLVVNTSTERIIFSCELAGLREYVGCFHIEEWMARSNVIIEWFESPSNVFSGITRRPLKVRFHEKGKDIFLGETPQQEYQKMIRRKIRNILIAFASYLIAIFVVKKLINLSEKEK
jgi:hypothetical protein